MTPPKVAIEPVFLRPIAHRGLHAAAAGRIENSGPAFAAAIAAGYAIECDLRAARDGGAVVFHDATLERLVDAQGPVAARTAAELAQLAYRSGGSHILTFADLLDLTAGAVPLLVEVKSEWAPPDAAFLATIAALASAYRGPIALMSFDPAIVAALASRAPGVPRGLVSGSYASTAGEGWWPGQLTAERRAALRALSEFDAAGASFAAYEIGALPAPATVALRARGVPVFTWTVRSAADRMRAAAHADAMIFEGFTPVATQ